MELRVDTDDILNILKHGLNKEDYEAMKDNLKPFIVDGNETWFDACISGITITFFKED